MYQIFLQTFTRYDKLSINYTQANNMIPIYNAILM